MTTRREVEKAVETVTMDPPGRHILLALLVRADYNTAEVESKWAPTFTELERITGYSRSTLTEWMKTLTESKWVSRTTADGTSKSGFAISIGDSVVDKPKRSRSVKPKVEAHDAAEGVDGAYRQAAREPDDTVSRGGTDHTAERHDDVPPGGMEQLALLIKNSPTESSTTNSTENPPPPGDGGSSDETKAKKTTKPKPPRPDVDEICVYLADKVEALGVARPTINDDWRRDARLLLDQKRAVKVDVERVKNAIDWIHQDAFWHRNILSMPKLRKQWDRISLDRAAELNNNGRRNGGLGTGSYDKVRDTHKKTYKPI